MFAENNHSIKNKDEIEDKDLNKSPYASGSDRP